MSKSPGPRFSPLNPRKEGSDLQRGESSNNDNDRSRPAFWYIKVAGKKVAGFFAKFSFRRRKQTLEGAKSIPSKNNYQAKGVSFPTDISSASSTKSLSTFASSRSSGSSGASFGQVGNFSLEEIYKATDNFSPDNKIGEGGFGNVYKGKLKDGTPVAVKRAKKDMLNRADFKNEILALSTIEHLNLVRLYGYLENGDERIILVEYVSNGTLREHLDGKSSNDSYLPWNDRPIESMNAEIFMFNVLSALEMRKVTDKYC